MRTIVVYEPMCAETSRIAEVVGTALQGHGHHVDLISADDATADIIARADLVVVGGLGATHGSVRRHWLHLLGTGHGRPIAVFSTDGANGEARDTERSLERHGYVLLVPPERFATGEASELERARHWAGHVAVAHLAQP